MENMEEVLAKGQQVPVDMTTANPGPAGVAERFNLHMGTPYRLIISGMNPTDPATFDGVMTELSVVADEKGFSLKRLVLEKGLSWDNWSEKKPFAREEFNEQDGYRLIGFGKINDPDGFFRARDRILGGQ
ncbi:MAG: hypothetical protein NTW67_06435 [Candidatus Woesearchaeota archaeon]|nr:hypothetical protein [Candidatus Woesearchaeota archaeon]